MTIDQGEAFSPLAELRSRLDKVLRRPLFVSITADQSEWALFSWLQTTEGRRGTDLMMLIKSAAILSLLQQTATPSSSGEWTEYAEFSPLAL
jgi:hypothetical protein